MQEASHLPSLKNPGASPDSNDGSNAALNIPGPVALGHSVNSDFLRHIDVERNLRYERYDPAREAELLPAISDLISGDLSEPYSIYVYRYFLYEWGRLCFVTVDAQSRVIGVVICKLEQHRGGPYRGYIAMLAVQKDHRGQGIATNLVKFAIEAMEREGADEVALETEVDNIPSLRLYASLGFLRSKRLHRYYLNGNEAFRLLLYLKDGVAAIKTYAPEYPPEEQPAELEGSVPDARHGDDHL